MCGSSLFTPLSSPPRDEELAIVQELLLEEPDCRLVTLVGPAGAGKTRLACRVAMRVRDAFRDGVCVVRLATTPSADRLPAAIVGALGLPLPAQETLEACLLDGVRGKEMLLLLDSFEHLLQGAVLIDDLLFCAPRIKLLITSRARLNLRAEWVRQMDRVSRPIAKQAGRVVDVAPLPKLSIWGRSLVEDNCGRTGDGGISRQRTNLGRLAQASQMASTAG